VRRAAVERDATPPDALLRILLGAAPACAAAVAAVLGDVAAAPRAWLGLLLLAAPFAERRLMRGRAPARQREAVLAGLLAQLAGLALLGLRAPACWVAACCQALARARSPGAAALGGLLALGTAVVALRESPSPWTLAAPFAASLGVLPGLAALAAHAARSRALRARRSRARHPRAPPAPARRRSRRSRCSPAWRSARA
jgi:hypothetical protein